MENVSEGVTDGKSCATDILKEENAEEGGAFIQGTQKEKSDFKLHLDAPNSSSMMVKQAKRTMGNRLEHETHPMNSDLILKKIFEFSSVNDLKSCRLVSKKWRDLSLGSWRRKAVLKTGRLLKKPEVGADYGLDPAMAGFISFIKTTPKVFECPFLHYDMNINDDDFDLRHKYKIKQKKSMLEFFSSSVQHLTINCDDLGMLCMVLTKLLELRALHLGFSCEELYVMHDSTNLEGRECPLRDLQFTLTKLYELGLTITNCSLNLDRVRNINFPWKKIFRSVPALESFTLTCRGDETVTVADEVIWSLCKARKEANFSILNLRDLSIFPTCSARRIGRIVECQFPLQELWFSIDKDDSRNISWILEWLKTQAETLEFINFDINNDNHPQGTSQQLAPNFTSKVKLPNLKTLMLQYDCVWAFHLLSSLDLPNLEELGIGSVNILRTEEKQVLGPILQFDKCACSLPNLNDFICSEAVFGVIEWQILAKSMPNLSTLRVSLGERTFPIVYQLWPQLQTLHLYANAKSYSLMDDYSITGLPVVADQPRLESRVPNITDLRNLRTFWLDSRLASRRGEIRPRPGTCISDVSATYGFLQLPDLQVLHIESVCKFSPDVLAALEEHVSDVRISEPTIFESDEVEDDE